MTPPPGDGNPFSSSQDAGANPVDAALDKAARIAETLLENIGPPEPETTPPPLPAPLPVADTPPADAAGADEGHAEAQRPDPIVGADDSTPAEDLPVQAGDDPTEGIVDGPAVPASSDEPIEPPAPVVPTEEDIPALVNDGPIEDQLEKIEGLLDEAQAQIGGAAPAKDKTAPPPAAPVETTVPANPDEPGTSPTDDLPPEAEIRFDDDGPLAQEEEEEEALVRPPRTDPDTAPGQLVILLRDALCGLLDRVDRPFVRVSYATRQILGVCALVTLLASIATWILARL